MLNNLKTIQEPANTMAIDKTSLLCDQIPTYLNQLQSPNHLKYLL